jgi:predicted O-methyltransferase YrrM
MKIKLISLISIALFIYSCSTPQSLSSKEPAKTDLKYTFTSDWFTHHISNWTLILRYMKGKPDLTYLEIGAYEGRSFFWVLDNILTHPSSKAIAIDIFDGDFEQRFLNNMRNSGHSSKISVLKGFSQEKLRDLKLNSIDLIYIDGDHKGKSVLQDIILSWDLLKEGGILIIDDYKWFEGLPMKERPEFAVDVFKVLFHDEFHILIDDYQLIVQKYKTWCNEAMGSIKRAEVVPLTCSNLGPYVFYWKPRKLYNSLTNREIPLNPVETSLVENILLGLKLGFELEVKKGEKDLYEKMFKRLGLHGILLSPKEK